MWHWEQVSFSGCSASVVVEENEVVRLVFPFWDCENMEGET